MSGSHFGLLFSLTTFGESHGPAIGGVVDGCPAGIPLTAEDIQHDLDRRKPGQSRHVTQRRESDTVEILSGVFEGLTTGTPIGLLIRNTDHRSSDYSKIKDLFRPSHADYTYHQKFGLRDYRGGGRSSARETAVRVAAGAVAKAFLKQQFGVSIYGYLSQLGEYDLPCTDLDQVEQNPFFCAHPAALQDLEQYLDALRVEGNSVGAAITTVAQGVPPGWGEPVFDRLDADLAKAMMGINAAKGIEIGAGFAAVSQKGSEHRDEITPKGFLSNQAGGVLGGISSGQDIVVRTAFKPTSSIRIPGQTVNIHGEADEVVTTGRHDPCVGIRATPICEAMMALVLADHALRQRGQNGQNAEFPMKPIPRGDG